MNFFSDEMRNNYKFNANNAFKQNTSKKKYRCICPIFSNIKQFFSEKVCNRNCQCADCCCCGSIRHFIKYHPYCFAGIFSAIFFIFLMIIVIIIVTTNKKDKDKDKEIVPKTTKINEFKNFDELDEIYNDMLNNDDGTLDQFREYLASKASNLNEEQKVHLVYRWLTENIIYDTDGDVERDPKEFFQEKTTVCSGYARLFRSLLTAMNYDDAKIINIAGYAKGSDYSVLKDPEVTHEWNAVKINDEWCLIDATWDAGVKNYTYFCTRPECFVRDHLARNESERFLDNPIDVTTFHHYAWTSGLYCVMNGQISEDVSIKNSCSGKYTFKYDAEYDDSIKATMDSDNQNNVEVSVNKIKSGEVEISYNVKVKGGYYIYIIQYDVESGKGNIIASLYVQCD